MIIVGEMDISEEAVYVHSVYWCEKESTNEKFQSLRYTADEEGMGIVDTETSPVPVIFKSDVCRLNEFIRSLKDGDHILVNGKIPYVVSGDLAFSHIDGDMINLEAVILGDVNVDIAHRNICMDEVITKLSDYLEKENER